MVLVVLAAGVESNGSTGRMRPGTLASQASIPLEHVQYALKILASAGEIEYEWRQHKDGTRARTFAYRVLLPDDYHPELTRQAA